MSRDGRGRLSRALAVALSAALLLACAPSGALASPAPEYAEPLSEYNTAAASVRADADVTISSFEELCVFADMVNGKNGYTANRTLSASLDGDIDCGGGTLSPMCSQSAPYNGTFYGNGFTVSNFSIIVSGSVTSGVGFFGGLGSSAKVYDLVLADASVEAGDATGVGAVCGYLAGVVDACEVSDVSVSGFRYVGGAVGQVSSNGTLTNCDVSVTIDSAEGSVIGGIAGYVMGRVGGCEVGGTVSGGQNTGGVAGYSIGMVSGCRSSASVAGAVNAGGIVGQSAGTISFCTGGGYTGGTSSVGGIVGINSGGIFNCLNTGEVSASGESVGGIVGYNNANSNALSVVSCGNRGTVSGTKYVGGIAGTNYESTIVNCYNTGVISGRGAQADYLGGIAGTNTGAVSSRNIYSTLNYCFNAGRVSAASNSSASKVGGIVGYIAAYERVQYCYWLYPTVRNGVADRSLLSTSRDNYYFTGSGTTWTLSQSIYFSQGSSNVLITVMNRLLESHNNSSSNTKIEHGGWLEDTDRVNSGLPYIFVGAVIDISKSSAEISSGSYTYDGVTRSFDAGVYIVTGSTSGNRLSVTGGSVDITLDDVSITLPSAISFSPLRVLGGASLKLRLSGANTLSSGATSERGINLSDGTLVDIDGSGSLEVSAGMGADGIGGRGSVIVSSGTLTAVGGVGGDGINATIVKVSGGNVTARGGESGAGIGGTVGVFGGTVHAYGGYGGAGIGSGAGSGAEMALISGGTVYAYGGCGAAGIGAGDKGSIESIGISGGAVTAVGGDGGAGIGGGIGSENINIQITSGTVAATGTIGGAGIGGGADGENISLVISGGVVSARADDAAGIGGCDAVIRGGSVFSEGGAETVAWDSSGEGRVRVFPAVFNLGEECAEMRPRFLLGLPEYYNISNIVANGEGRVCLWLPLESICAGKLSVNNITSFFCVTPEDGELRAYIGTLAELNVSITYIADGVRRTDTYMIGERIIKPADPERAGSIFDGWDPAVPEYMPGRDLTVIATWRLGEGVVDVSLSSVTITALGYTDAEGFHEYTGAYTLTGETSENTVTVEGGDHSIALLSLQMECDVTPLSIDAGHTDITLVEANSLSASADGCPAVRVRGEASVAFAGGALNADGGENAAAIGGGAGDAVGDITINGGVLNLYGGAGAAAIGSGRGGVSGDIVVSGGVITAFGGTGAAAVGAGAGAEQGRNAVRGGSVNAVGGFLPQAYSALEGGEALYTAMFDFGAGGTQAYLNFTSGVPSWFVRESAMTDFAGKAYIMLPERETLGGTVSVGTRKLFFSVLTSGSPLRVLCGALDDITAVLTYVVGENYLPRTCYIGESLAQPADASLPGSIFLGWSASTPDIMPAEDLTITAMFKKPLSISGGSASLEVGGTMKLLAIITLTDKPVFADVTWSVSDSSVASIAEDGTVTGLKRGVVIVTAITSDGKYFTAFSFAVTDNRPAVNITMYSKTLGDSHSVKVNWWKRYSSAVVYLGYECVNSKAASVVWSSNSKLVKVSSDGVVTNMGRNSRSALITVTAYDAGGRVIASDSLRITFYKFRWRSIVNARGFLGDEEAAGSSAAADGMVFDIAELIYEPSRRVLAYILSAVR